MPQMLAGLAPIHYRIAAASGIIERTHTRSNSRLLVSFSISSCSFRVPVCVRQ